MAITALVPWYGSNRMLGEVVGQELAGCSWVGVPFAGGMAELFHIKARTILVSDLHRDVVNLANVMKLDGIRDHLLRKLSQMPFHPDVLEACQTICDEPLEKGVVSPARAEAYFVCCWMGRSAKAGTDGEWSGGPATRWNAGGGDSAVRFQNAIQDMGAFAEITKRCTFEVMDAFDFYQRCEDRVGHGIYGDPPFPRDGRKYRFNCGKTDADERAWHTRLRDSVSRFKETRIVMRFYDHPLIRELYPEGKWVWRFLNGRDSANNAEKPEVLILNGPIKAK